VRWLARAHTLADVETHGTAWAVRIVCLAIYIYIHVLVVHLGGGTPLSHQSNVGVGEGEFCFGALVEADDENGAIGHRKPLGNVAQ